MAFAKRNQSLQNTHLSYIHTKVILESGTNRVMGSKIKQSPSMGGFRTAFGCTVEGLALFRISLGILLVFELVTRFRYLHPFYSDEG